MGLGRPLDKAEVGNGGTHLEVVVEKSELGTKVETQTKALGIVQKVVHRGYVHYILGKLATRLHLRGIEEYGVAPNSTTKLCRHLVGCYSGRHSVYLGVDIGNAHEELKPQTHIDPVAHTERRAEICLQKSIGAQRGVAEVVGAIAQSLEDREYILREVDIGIETSADTQIPEYLLGVEAHRENVGAQIGIQAVDIGQTTEELIGSNRAVQGRNKLIVALIDEILDRQEVAR